jgi:glycosyltransferase involved in cell wall biosynthesis
MDEPALASAIVLTYNEELNIEACLKSIAGWCQEIFVVDSGSTDQTQAIARRYTHKIYVHPYTDHATQWDWALKNLPIAGEWILPLDADHVVSDELAHQIVAVTRHPDTAIDGYYSRHQYLFWGRPLRGFKGWGLRLFKKTRTVVDTSELVDWRFVVQGKTARLSGVLYEHNRKEDSIDFWIDKHQKFSSRIAIEELLRCKGLIRWSLRPNLLGNPDERIIWFKTLWLRLPLYLRPFLYFFYRYFLRVGFLDGKTGFIYHFFHAFWFRLLVDIKIAKLRQRLANGELTITELADSFGHRTGRN